MKERFERQYQILFSLLVLNNKGMPSKIIDIKEYIEKEDFYITENIVDCSVRQYRRNGLLKRRHDPYRRPFQYLLSSKGLKQLEWLEDYNSF